MSPNFPACVCLTPRVACHLASIHLETNPLSCSKGLGPQPFDRHMAVLINEKTSSACEIAAQFVKGCQARLAGRKTAGLTPGADVFDVGYGYKLFLPVFAWYGPERES